MDTSFDEALGDALEDVDLAAEQVADDGPQEGYAAEAEAVGDEPAPSGAAPPGFVPLAALLEMRDEAKALKERLRDFEQQASEPPVFETEAEQMQFAIVNTRLDISEDVARARHGDQMVDVVQDWFGQKSAQSPAFRAEVLSHRNPYEYAIDVMRREHALSQINPDEFAQYQAWRAAMAGQAGYGADASSQHAAARGAALRAPSPSLASASSAGGVQHVPIGPGRAFDSTFR
jgi:hypothetical protein